MIGSKYSGLNGTKLKTNEKFESSLPISLTKVEDYSRVWLSTGAIGALAAVIFSSTYISVVSWLGFAFGQ